MSYPTPHPNLVIPQSAWGFECKDSFSPVLPNSNTFPVYPGAAACCGGSISSGQNFQVWITYLRLAAFNNNSPGSNFNIDVGMGLWSALNNNFWAISYGEGQGFLSTLPPFAGPNSPDPAFLGNICVLAGTRSEIEIDRGLEMPLPLYGAAPGSSDTFVPCPILRFMGASGLNLSYDYLIRGFIAPVSS